MSQIQFLYQEGVEPCEKEPLKVRLDGIICGEIRKVATGYQYFPKNSKTGGDILASVTLVQRSLKEDEE
jgi:hypothetical protein